jgi:hypothetical protein
MIILSGVYRALVKTGERVLPQTAKKIIKWDHPAGPQTIFFWAPLMKWSLVIAGLGKYNVFLLDWKRRALCDKNIFATKSRRSKLLNVNIFLICIILFVKKKVILPDQLISCRKISQYH